MAEASQREVPLPEELGQTIQDVPPPEVVPSKQQVSVEQQEPVKQQEQADPKNEERQQEAPASKDQGQGQGEESPIQPPQSAVSEPKEQEAVPPASQPPQQDTQVAPKQQTVEPQLPSSKPEESQSPKEQKVEQTEEEVKGPKEEQPTIQKEEPREQQTLKASQKSISNPPEQQNVQQESSTKPQPTKQEPQQKQPEKQITAEQAAQDFLASYQGEPVKPAMVNTLRSLIAESSLLSSQSLQKFYQQNTEGPRSLQLLREWLTKYQSQVVEEQKASFVASPDFQKITQNFQTLRQLLAKADHQKTTLKMNIGVGENRYKSSCKFGLALLDSVQNGGVRVEVEIKTKKKTQLRTLIQGQLKRQLASSEDSVLKLCKVDFTQNDKSLLVQITVPELEEALFGSLVSDLNSMREKETSPVLKVEGQVLFKNSIRRDQHSLQDMKFVKWLGEGFHCKVQVEGNKQVIRHCTEPFAEYLPLLKVVRSGEIQLKLKNPDNIDKLFERLGISQIAEETPSLSQFLSETSKHYLQEDTLPGVASIIRLATQFVAVLPNERVSWEASVSCQQLKAWVSVSGDSCQELRDVIEGKSG